MKTIQYLMTSPARLSLPVLALLIGLTFISFEVSATHNCSSPSATADSDGDGFTDAQECLGFTTLGTTAADGTFIQGRNFPRCETGMNRQDCVDPDTKDLFVLYVPATGGYFTTLLPNPFTPNFVAYGLTFNGLTALGITVHKLDPGQIPLDTRTVTNGSVQKAVVVFEDLDPTDIVLGYCQYGTPNTLSGGACTVYTQRIWDYINTTCSGLQPVTFASGAQTSLEEVFKGYATQTVLHEILHTSGGVTSKYVNNYNGYHYAPNTTVMEQYVVATARDGICKFAVHKDFNVTNDSRAIKLK